MSNESSEYESLVLPAEAFTKKVFQSSVPHPLELRRAPLVAAAKGEELEPLNTFNYVNVEGRIVNNEARFACHVDVWNRLLLGGTAVSAKSLSYYFSGIQWCPGRGWPTYSTRCPRTDLVPSMLFPSAYAHSLIVQFGGYYWPECANSNVGTGNQITDVFVGPNDDQFGDNTGAF